ncbi:MAG TPA: nuclear transport factor 2 family protein [Chryseolinea sp.]|nr:nuclear transport factor 2 family protein [Chryseolinea sp.]
MKPIIYLYLLAILCLNANTLLAQSLNQTDEKTTAFLKQFRSDYNKHMLNNKQELITVYYADEIRLMPAFQKTIMSKGNALVYHKAFSARFDINEYEREAIETLDLGARVVETGLFTMKLKLRSSGKEYEVNGKYQDIWKKLENNKLSLITQAWNHNDRTEIDEHFRFVEVPAVQTAFQTHVPVNSNISFELAALNKLLEVCIIQGDNKVWSQFYTDDVILIANFNPIQQGRKAVEKYLEEEVNGMPVFEKLDIRNDEIDYLGAYVIEYASHVANWRYGESSGVNTGKNIRIWRREPDGSLKMFRQIGSYD